MPKFNLRNLKVGVVGLGYVGLPLAVEFGKHFETVGFDIKPARIDELRDGRDSTLEVDAARSWPRPRQAAASRRSSRTCKAATSSSSRCPRRSTSTSVPT